MSISQIPAQFNINGVIDTTSPVFQNMERIANNSGAWITYDVHNGAWSVVINQAVVARIHLQTATLLALFQLMVLALLTCIIQ